MERLEGRSTIPVTWAELDADYGLKLPTLFHPCLDALTAAVAGAFDLFGMGRRGIAPITHYVELAADGEAVALGRPLELRYTVELVRAQLPPSRAGGAPRERLLLDQHIALHGFRRAGAATDLGFDDGSGAPLEAGAFRLIQVFTRPFAPPGERRVTTVPEEFAALREQAPRDPPPGLEQLAALPAGAAPLGAESGTRRVWGLGHTDINHHVTVAEHLRLQEAALVERVAEAGLPVATHRTTRMACMFRRPFFPGDQALAHGRLYGAGAHTVLLGGTFRDAPGEGREPEPSIVARLEGRTAAVAPHDTP